MCNKHVDSTVTSSSRFHCPIGVTNTNHESRNNDTQGTRAPTTTLYVLCELQESVRLYLP